MGKADSRDIEASRLVPLAAQEGVDRVDTCKREYIPSVCGQCTGVGHTMLGEARRVSHKRRTEKRPESCENSLRC